MFDDGRVVFVGKKYTGKTGVCKKQMEPNVYAELLTTIVRTGVLEEPTSSAAPASRTARCSR